MMFGLRSMLKKPKAWMSQGVRLAIAANQLLLGRMASMQVRAVPVVSSLQEVEFRASSQWGEDGIIDWLVERCHIPASAQTFIEFGVEDYREANTRFLLQNRNWRGLILDGGSAMLEALCVDDLSWKHDLTAKSAFITRENINDLISSGGMHGEIGLLSIDIDGNDYWVWDAIDVVQPILCVCEYNAVFGDVYPVSVPYAAQFARTAAHSSNLYFGASIAALRALATRKGYRFVGTTSAGNDAFFVREDYARTFVDSSIQRIFASPSRFRESRNAAGELTFITGAARLRALGALPVVHLGTGETIALNTLQAPYSEDWLAAMGT